MNSDRSKLSFGRYLQAARLQKGLSLEEVARETRIRMEYLLQIENEDHGRLPNEVFVKGFLRAYAKAVGADGEEAVQRYLARRSVLQKIDASGLAPTRTRPRVWTNFLLGILGVVVIAGLSIYVPQWLSGTLLPGPAPQPQTEARQSSSPEADPQPPAGVPGPETAQVEAPGAVAPPSGPVEAPATPEFKPPVAGPESLPPAPAAETTPSRQSSIAAPDEAAADAGATEAAEVAADAPAETTPAETTPAEVTLRIAAEEQTWMKITPDDGQPAEYMLQPGEVLSLEAAEGFNLLIGNAGGVTVTVNGEPVPVPGESGQVVTLRLP